MRAVSLVSDWEKLSCERCKTRLQTDVETREAAEAASAAAEMKCGADGGTHNWQLIPGESRLFCSKCAKTKSL